MPRVSKGVFPFLFSPLPHPFLFFSPFLPTPVPLPTLLSLSFLSLSLSFSLCLSSSPLPAFPPLSSFLFQGPPEKCTSHTRERSKLACYWAPVNGDDGPFREELSKWCPLFSTPPPHFFFFLLPFPSSLSSSSSSSLSCLPSELNSPVCGSSSGINSHFLWAALVLADDPPRSRAVVKP